MRQYYPESKQGEYKKLSTSRYNGKKVTIGTIVKMIKDRGGLKREPSIKSLIRQFNRN